MSGQAAQDEPTINDTDTQVDDTEGLTETWLTDVDAPENYNWNWREVIKDLLEGEAGYIAYANAYEIDITEPRGRRVAEANYSRLLRNAKFTRLWKQVLEEQGFNEHNMDAVMLKMIADDMTPHQTRRALIRDFNELNGRIVKRTDFTSDGERVQVVPMVVSDIKGRDASTETEAVSSSPSS